MIKSRSLVQAGYTLVEVLIAVVLLVALMFTASFSYSVYLKYWDGRLGSFDQTIFQYQGLLQIKDTIEAAIPYIVKGEAKDFTYYFLGRDEGFTFVTVAPIFAMTTNDSSVVRIFREQTAKGYQLVYEEAPLTDKLLIDLNQELSFRYRTVLAEVAEPILFRYFGWASREAKFSGDPKKEINYVWNDQFDAALRQIQPERVRIYFGNQYLDYSLVIGHHKLLNLYIENGAQ